MAELKSNASSRKHFVQERRERPEQDVKSRVRVFVVLTAAVIDCLREINCLCFQGYQKAGDQHLIVSNGWPWKETECHCCWLTASQCWHLTYLLDREEVVRALGSSCKLVLQFWYISLVWGLHSDHMFFLVLYLTFIFRVCMARLPAYVTHICIQLTVLSVCNLSSMDTSQVHDYMRQAFT